jgi:hypothetical protein
MPTVADWVIDYTKDYYENGFGIKILHDKPHLHIPSLKEEDIVFVKTDFLKNSYFQNEVLPQITVPIVLISGVSSYNVSNYKPLIESDKIIKWFCTNPPCVHEKVIGIPIGFEEMDREGGNQELLKSFMGLDTIKKDKIFLPYHKEENNNIRNKSIEYLKSLDFVDNIKEKIPFKEYLEVVSQYKYCICLEGTGFDTHRNYECVLVNTVPIIKKSGVESIYEEYKVPTCSIDSWEDIDNDFYENLRNTPFNFSTVNNFLQTKTHLKKII